MSRICEPTTGLFPAPKEIAFQCSCPTVRWRGWGQVPPTRLGREAADFLVNQRRRRAEVLLTLTTFGRGSSRA